MKTTHSATELLPLQKQSCNIELTLQYTAFEAYTIARSEIHPSAYLSGSEVLVHRDAVEGQFVSM